MQNFYIYAVVLRCVTSSEIDVLIYKVMSVTTVKFNANNFLSLNSGVDKVWCVALVLQNTVSASTITVQGASHS